MEKEAHIQNTDIGNIHISEEVIAVIAGIAATEGPEVYSLVGYITNEIVSKMGIKSLSTGLTVRLRKLLVKFLKSCWMRNNLLS